MLGWKHHVKEFILIKLSEKPCVFAKFNCYNITSSLINFRVMDKEIRWYHNNKFCWSVQNANQETLVCIYDETSASIDYKKTNNVMMWDAHNKAAYEFEQSELLNYIISRYAHIEITNNDLCVAYSPENIAVFTKTNSSCIRPFYLNILNSDFNGVTLSDDDKKLLLLYGARPFEILTKTLNVPASVKETLNISTRIKEILNFPDSMRETLKASVLWKDSQDSTVPEELVWTWVF
jgi:hypothetical protein